ncbi:hypothetical protein [Pantoea agglomerans]|uniref:hypothetical protein n=1 Tax=Enterobacter agglomerans TaxID=549 RepID=UPI001F2D4236|nr:hypothetical protein [Pantoea agglomerans]
MKVKENMGDGRGRPRKYARGEMQYRKLWLPENLLMELRVAARVRRYTTNDEIISRLIASMQFMPGGTLLKRMRVRGLLRWRGCLTSLFSRSWILSGRNFSRRKAAERKRNPLFPERIARSAAAFPKTCGGIWKSAPGLTAGA